MTDVRNPVSGSVVMDISRTVLINNSALTATTWTDIDLPALAPTRFKAKSGLVGINVYNSTATATIAFRPNGSADDYYLVNLNSCALNDVANGAYFTYVIQVGTDGKIEYYSENNNTCTVTCEWYIYNSD